MMQLLPTEIFWINPKDFNLDNYSDDYSTYHKSNEFSFGKNKKTYS